MRRIAKWYREWRRRRGQARARRASEEFDAVVRRARERARRADVVDLAAERRRRERGS